MSSEDENDNQPRLTQSSVLTNQSLISNLSPTEIDIDPMQEQGNEELLLPIIHTSKSPSISSKQSSRIPSPSLSPSSPCVATALIPQTIQLPSYLEREILIKINFDQLSKKINGEFR